MFKYLLVRFTLSLIKKQFRKIFNFQRRIDWLIDWFQRHVNPTIGILFQDGEQSR